VVLVLLAAAPAWATTITYGSYNRPLLFEGVVFNGQTFDVEVTWGSSYNAVYSTQLPMFLGDESGAMDAVQALIQALVDNGHTPSSLQSYIVVPYANSGTLATSWGSDLNAAELTARLVNTLPYNSYGNTGYTVWTVADPVKAESISWGKIKALFQQ
jgi:hypothetical protein